MSPGISFLAFTAASKNMNEVRAATEDFAATRIFGETWKGQNNASLLEVNRAVKGRSSAPGPG